MQQKLLFISFQKLTCQRKMYFKSLYLEIFVKIIPFEIPSSNGKNILLQCRAPSNVKNAQYTWELNGKVISKKQTITVEKSTIDNMQEYKCTVIGRDENNIQIKFESSSTESNIRQLIQSTKFIAILTIWTKV